ncbi:AMP-binding protein [Hyphomicrobium sp. B1]|uniref:AMP-binding protein n=1 Tax=Hyphomicrobium sp. B1 TaxID=3075651 RepID=UPI003C2C2E26
MLDIISALRRNAIDQDASPAFSDDSGSLTHADLSARVAECAANLESFPHHLGLLGENSNDAVVAQLAGWVAGKIIVPIPAFFSSAQQKHILADCSVSHVIATPNAVDAARQLGVEVVPVTNGRRASPPELRHGGGQIIYTSGSTGRPKGVRLALSQIERSAAMLVQATCATQDDLYLSVLPLPLLLETICAICVPLFAKARTRFDRAMTASVARGQPQGLSATFAKHDPTTSVLVPELLATWVAELDASGQKAPTSLRFVAIGGAPVATAMANKAWSKGIPAHEGYGLSECCSVVAVNRPGKRRPGTVGQPLPGLNISIEDGEIVVDGPTIMQGYQNGCDAAHPWRTGDLGMLDADGYLRISGRKDNLIVTSFGRNVSPEWIEALITTDERIAACAVLGHGEPYLSVLIVPSSRSADWFATVSKAEVLLALSNICRDAPVYAIPRDFVLLARNDAVRRNLLTPNDRFRRALLPDAYAEIKAAAERRPVTQEEEMSA